MIVIDTNVLIILIIGGIDTKLISKHKRTNLYDENNYVYILNLIKDFDNLLVLPNIWTEVDSKHSMNYVKDRIDFLNWSGARWCISDVLMVGTLLRNQTI